MISSSNKTKIEEAALLRKNSQPELALALLQGLLKSSPEDPQISYQIAWTFDSMGKESEAVPHYEAALANGLSGTDRKGAFLGLGSTYRCLGEYQKSLSVFDRGISEFPEERGLKVFRAITLYNLKRPSEAVSVLLTQLLDTTDSAAIKTYDRALRFYADRLDEVWK